MSRNFVRKGDKTTANGDVLEGDASFKVFGIAAGFHGAKVYCPACNSTGHIITIPPHHPFKINGKQIALEGDLCVCRCSTPPRLLSSQSQAHMLFEQSHTAAAIRSKPIAERITEGAILITAELASGSQANPDEDTRMAQAAYGDPRYWTAQVGAPAPGTSGEAPTDELSGAQWVARYPTSTSTSDLISPFREHVAAFIAALQAGGAVVSINATLRPPERVYLMHYAHAVANGADPSTVPSMEGVAINWAHRDSSGNLDNLASRSAAQEMVSAYGIVYPPALSSRHTEGRAIDMTINNFVGKTFSTAAGESSTLANQSDLESLGSSYGVIKLRSDPPHWSDDGH